MRSTRHQAPRPRRIPNHLRTFVPSLPARPFPCLACCDTCRSKSPRPGRSRGSHPVDTSLPLEEDPTRNPGALPGCNAAAAIYSLQTRCSGLSPVLQPGVPRYNLTRRYTGSFPVSRARRMRSAFLPGGSLRRPYELDKCRYSQSVTASANPQPTV